MHPLKLLLGIICICLSLPFRAEADTIVPVPLTSPVFIPLELDPVVTFIGKAFNFPAERTIDFTPNLNQEFILFEPVISLNEFGFRFTVGARARDGLASMTGSFPPSPDPTFVNEVPVFPRGTTSLALFDIAIPSETGNRMFSITSTDLDGDIHPAELGLSAVPEPSTAILGLTAVLIGIGSVLWRRSRHS